MYFILHQSGTFCSSSLILFFHTHKSLSLSQPILLSSCWLLVAGFPPNHSLTQSSSCKRSNTPIEMENTRLARVSPLPLYTNSTFFKWQREFRGTLLSNMITLSGGSQNNVKNKCQAKTFSMIKEQERGI